MDADQLRYADGPSTEATTTIAATPAAVWALVTDIQLPARFSTPLPASMALGLLQQLYSHSRVILSSS